MRTLLHQTPKQKVRNPNKFTFQFIQTVVAVGFILATLFTAWTEPGLLPTNIFQKYSFQKAKQPSELAIENKTITPRQKPLIGIVAGHSGHDSGAVCSDGLTEVSINQQVAAYTQNFLLNNNLDVEILQEFDDRLTDFQAAALISIHSDSCNYINNDATGFKVAAPLANPHPERNARLTTCLRKRYAQTTGLPLHNSITLDMTSYHAFSEINNETTAAIIEIGFMNLDRQLLTENSEIVAQGIAAGILCFINNEDTSQ